MKIRMVALALALSSSLAMAQTESASSGGASAGDKQPPAARMKNELGLTDEQVQKMREIRDNGGSREEMQAVLTPEQRAKSAQLKKEHKAERSQRKARIQQELGLSDEQMEKMTEIRRNGGTREEMRAVLTPEQQAKFDSMSSKRSPHGPARKPAGASASKPAAASTPSSAPASTPAKASE